jgi:hypothetical protein
LLRLFIIFERFQFIRQRAVGIATGHELDGPGSIPDRGKIFSSQHKTESGAHTAPFPVGIGGSFPEVKAAEA